jgi:uncharacterized protein (DUF1778 family)
MKAKSIDSKAFKDSVATSTNRISLRVTAQELERMTYAAKLEGKSLRKFIIDSALEAASIDSLSTSCR